jgi:hypothetical protein
LVSTANGLFRYDGNSFYNLTGVDFILALVKNVKKMEQEIEVLDNIRKISDKYFFFALETWKINNNLNTCSLL